MSPGSAAAFQPRLAHPAAVELQGLPDDKLLAQFFKFRNEAAFAVLLARHGPLVLGVCQRILGNSSDAEDAFQATFLVLVSKGAPCGSRGNWRTGSMALPNVRRENSNRRRLCDINANGRRSPCP